MVTTDIRTIYFKFVPINQVIKSLYLLIYALQRMIGEFTISWDIVVIGKSEFGIFLSGNVSMMSIVEVNLLEDRIGEFFLILIFGHQGYKTEIVYHCVRTSRV